jgi:hypothetical protein
MCSLILTLFLVSFLVYRHQRFFADFCGDFDFSLINQKIEMDCTVLAKCSESKNHNNNNTSTMATTMASSNYWTATAQHVIPRTVLYQQREYKYDDCGVKYLVTNNDDVWQPCESWCTTCGYPPRMCDPYFTRCTGTKIGRWFNEEEGMWIEAEQTLTSSEQQQQQQQQQQEEEEEEEERWNQHKFGLCPICKIGLDDRADFTFNYSSGAAMMICCGCDEKQNICHSLQQQSDRRRRRRRRRHPSQGVGC